ncbi:MAG: hypothetical protein ACMUIU_08405 [bacterium]
MKINLTKLLELSKMVDPPPVDSKQTDASYFLKTGHDSTSSDEAYSFELEEDAFSLTE